MKNLLHQREEKFKLFESLISGLDSVADIYNGLSQPQHERLKSKGFDIEAGQKHLKEILFRDANSFVEELKGNVREEFAANLRELESERDRLVDSIEKNRINFQDLGLLTDDDIEKSLTPLNDKLKAKLGEIVRTEETIKRLTPNEMQVDA